MRINFRIPLKKPHLILSLLIAAVFICNFLWIKKDTRSPQGNGFNDIFPAINFYLDISGLKARCPTIINALASFSITKAAAAMRDYLHTAFFLYPPLVPLSYAFFYLLFGPHTRMEIIVNSFYLAIAICAVYGIGKKIRDEKTGLLSAFVFLSFPGVIALSRTAFAEFFSMCLMVLTLYILLKTDCLQNKKYSIFLGISLGLTALTKWDFPPAVIGPFVLSLLGGLQLSRRSLDLKKQVWKNFFLALIIAALISSFWYLISFKDIFFRLDIKDRIFAQMSEGAPKHIRLLKTITYYPLAVINEYIKPFYFICLVISAIMFVRWVYKNWGYSIFTNNRLFYPLFLISWITLPYICFTYVKIFFPPHMILILPALALIIGIGIMCLKNTIIRITLISLIILNGLFFHAHSFFTFNKRHILTYLYNTKIHLTQKGKLLITPNILSSKEYPEAKGCHPPDNRDWKTKDILSFIKINSLGLQYKPKVLILSHYFEFTHLDFQYYNLLWNNQLYIAPRGHGRDEKVDEKSLFDYVVIITPDGKINGKSVRQIIKDREVSLPFNASWDQFLNALFQENKYVFLKEYALPDYATAKIYKLVEAVN